MTQSEYIAALRAKLREIASDPEAWGLSSDRDDIEALLAIEPDGRYEVNPIVRHAPTIAQDLIALSEVYAASNPWFPRMLPHPRDWRRETRCRCRSMDDCEAIQGLDHWGNLCAAETL